MKREIRKLTSNDLLLVKQLVSQIQRENGVLNPIDVSDSYLKEMLSKDSFHVFAAVKDNEVAGGLTAYELPMFASEEREMFLYDIIVSEAYRQQGIGRGLIEGLKKLCADKGIKTIFVGTSMDSQAAIHLYNSTGGKREDIPWFVYHLQ
jgi:aminoglycoside 3-N-acetyltransferase I